MLNQPGCLLWWDGWIDEGAALNIVHLELRKAFDMVFHKILMEKLME